MLHRSNKDLLESSLGRVGRILTDRFDINVYFEGNKCCTNNREIYLPSIPEDCSEELFKAIQGYLDHESAHIIFDDFSFNGVKIEDFSFNQLTRLWFMVVCDVKSEHQMKNMWPGTKENLDNALKWVIEHELLPKWNKHTFISKYTRSAFMYARGNLEFFDEIDDGDELLEKLKPIMPALKIAKEQPDALHCLALADWIVKVLGQDPEMPVMSPEAMEELQLASEDILGQIQDLLGGESDEDEEYSFGSLEPSSGSCGGAPGRSAEDELDPDGEPASGTATEDGSGETTEDGTGSAEDGTGSVEDESTEETSTEEDGEPKETKEAEYTSPSLGEVKDEFNVPADDIKAETEKFEQERSGSIQKGVSEFTHYNTTSDHDFYLPYSTVDDKIQVVKPGDKAQFMTDIKEVKQVSGVLLRRLRSVLLSRTQSVTQYDKTWGKLNTRSIPKLLTTGYTRVFKQKTIGEEILFRMTLLMDQSGSMSWNRKDENARKAAILFGEFCNQMGVPFEVLSFTTVSFDQETTNYWDVTDEERERFTRWGNLEINIYKEFHENWRKVGHRMSNMVAKKHNYDGEAVLLAAKRLLLAQKPGERLILFVFSDGRPEQSISKYQPHHQHYLKNVVKEVIKAGVECVGIGICTNSVKEYYPNWITIDDPSDLQSAQIEKLKEVFLQGRGKRRPR